MTPAAKAAIDNATARARAISYKASAEVRGLRVSWQVARGEETREHQIACEMWEKLDMPEADFDGWQWHLLRAEAAGERAQQFVDELRDALEWEYEAWLDLDRASRAKD